jgi:hypothetical protein
MAVERTSTPGITGSNGEKIPAAGDGRTDDNNSISNCVGICLAGKHRGGANRSDRPAGTIICYRKSVIDVGGDRSLIEHQTVWLYCRLLSDRQCRDAERKRHLDPVARPKQHRNCARGAGLVGRHIGDADLRMVGESLQRQKELLGPRQQSERAFIILCKDRLTGLREHCSGRYYSGTLRQRFRQSFITVVGSLVDQQKIDRDDFRFQPCNRSDERGEIDAGERVAALLRYDSIVDRDNGQKIRRDSCATNKCSKIDHCRFGAIEKSQVAMGVSKVDSKPPKPGQNEGNHGLEMAVAHSLLYRPRRAINAATRAGGHRFTVKGPAASTSTPSPGPRVTLLLPDLRPTATRPWTTKTEVWFSTASTAQIVPRTAAIACGVMTLNSFLPFGTSSSKALLLSSTESTRPFPSRSRRVYRAPFSTTMVTPALHRIVCVVKVELSAVHPPVADCAPAVAMGGSEHASATKSPG